jgi:hypothetical protein
MSLPEEIESDNDDEYFDEARSPRQSMTEKTHWSKTCCSDIRFESLGEGKAYRVKVYASNGLMRAGAWEACWKDMERVDVELEPIVDAKLQEELNRLAAEQERALELEEEAAAAAAAAVDEEIRQREEAERAEQSYMPDDVEASINMESSPQPEIPVDSSPPYDDDRRERDEERLREIYGDSAPSHQESSSVPQPPLSDFEPRETPASPSVEAFERREERRESRQQASKNASLPELVFEAIKVLMQDQKNVFIVLLSLAVLMLAVRGGSTPNELALQAVVPAPVPEVVVEKPSETFAELLETIQATVEEWEATETMGPTQQSTTEGAVDPCVPCSMALEAAEISLKVVPTNTVEVEVEVEVFRTITETMMETVTVEVLPTMIPKDLPSADEREVEPEAAMAEELAVEEVAQVGDGHAEE